MKKLVLVLALAACGDGGTSSPKDANPGDDGATVDAPPDAPGGGGSCQAITPWCTGGTCLAIPDAPIRGNRFAHALGANGAVYFAVAQNNMLARISPSTPLAPVPLPEGTEPGFRVGGVTAMTAVSPTDIYACTELTIVWHFDGTSWAQLPAGWLAGACDTLWAGAADDLWKIGDDYLSRKLDGGAWTAYGGGRQVYALAGRNANDVYFGGQHGYLAHWNGTQYEVLIDVSDDSDVPDVRDIAILGPDDVAFGDKRVIGGMLKTSTQLGYPAAPERTWGSSNDFWIVTRPQGATIPRALWRYDGTTWTQHTPPPGIDLDGLAITGTGPNDVWFIASHGTLHWDGTALESCAIWQPPQPTGRLVGVGANYDDLWLHDTAGGLWHSTNGGDFVDAHDGAAGVRGFDAHPAGVFVVAGTEPVPPNGTIPVAQRWNGAGWTDIACPYTAGEETLLRAAKVIAANDVWFAGDGGHVFRWNGQACTLVPHPLAITTFRHINATGPNDVWFFGDTATLHWNGTALVRHPSTISVVDSVAAGTSLWAIATNDVLQWNGTSWTSKGAGAITNGRRIYATSATDVWAYTDTLRKFDGTTWTDAPLPSTAYAGAGIGVGMWGAGATGDFAISLAGGIIRHQ